MYSLPSASALATFSPICTAYSWICSTCIKEKAHTSHAHTHDRDVKTKTHIIIHVPYISYPTWKLPKRYIGPCTLCSNFSLLCYAPMLINIPHYAPKICLLCSSLCPKNMPIMLIIMPQKHAYYAHHYAAKTCLLCSPLCCKNCKQYTIYSPKMDVAISNRYMYTLNS